MGPNMPASIRNENATRVLPTLILNLTSPGGRASRPQPTECGRDGRAPTRALIVTRSAPDELQRANTPTQPAASDGVAAQDIARIVSAQVDTAEADRQDQDCQSDNRE